MSPTLLIILDGWGYSEHPEDNAISLANTPVWDSLWQDCPHTLLSSSGTDVGLPDGQMGNSEVGHMTIGAGRVIYQDLSRISNAIADQSFFENPRLKKLITQDQGAIHLMGLLSPGGIHSHEDHLFAVLEALKHQKIPVYVHAFLDGRDTPPQSAKPSLVKLQDWFEKNPIGQIASICGRFYAMDRDNRYQRTQKAYEMLTEVDVGYHAASACEALKAAYARGETDEFVEPTRIGMGAAVIHPGDSVFFFNFRTDRTRQISYALSQSDFTGFERKHTPKIQFFTMTQYDVNLDAQILFPPQNIHMGLGEVLSKAHLTQLRLAETEKYAHVTFFFNGGIEPPYAGEDRILIPSPKVHTYDESPSMSAIALTDALVTAIEAKQHDVIICNYANADMLGHTGKLPAAIQAVETIDSCLGRVITALQRVNGQALITADHGNAECMVDTNHQPHTAHTTNLVPFIYVGSKPCQFISTQDPSLADVAPTLLNLLNLPPVPEMTGHDLLMPIT